jgi:MFS family permease
MTVAMEGALRPRSAIGPGVVSLLALGIFINYVDRGNVATAAPLIKDELRLSSTQIGLLFSAFFWSYTPSQILAGWLSERINAYRTLALGAAIWSIATIASGLATGFASLIVLRLLLGIGESAAFPCSSKLLAYHLPEHKLGHANGLIATGLALGPAFGTFVGGMLMAQFGWRAVFLTFGVLSLLWLLPWYRATHEASQRDAEASRGEAPSYLAILRCRESWGASIGHFCNNYSFYFVISWLPLYLVKTRGFSVVEMSELGGLIYVVYAASAMSSGWASDRWMERGASSNLVRKAAMIASNVGIALAMLGCALGDAGLSIASLFLAAVAFGLATTAIYATGQTLAGPHAAGKWISVQNCVGNVAGIVAPVITGLVIDRTGEFYWAFVVAGASAVMGIVAWGVVIRKVQPVKWDGARA